MTNTPSLKVAVMFHRIGPYHFARLRAAGAACTLTAVEVSGKDNTYAWNLVRGAHGFQRMTLFAQTDSRDESPSEVRRRVRAALEECQPAVVVVPGWADAEALAAAEWCTSQRVPAVAMSESTEWDEKRTGWKEWVKRRLMSAFSGALVGGGPHEAYVAQLGMERQRIFLGYDAVDNAHFAKGVEEIRKQKTENRKRYSLPDKYFLASSRFVEKKNLARLIAAYADYRKTAQSGMQKESIWGLVLLGDGPLRGEIERRIAECGVQEHVLLPGFKQYDELPVYYGLASAFVHASTTEQWGLVVNEAMASGLPVLVSNRCGCAHDLVREGENGFTFDPYNVEELAGLMLKVSKLQSQLSTFGNASRKIIAEWGPERFAQGLKSAVEMALQNPRPNPGLLDRLLLRLLFMR